MTSKGGGGGGGVSRGCNNASATLDTRNTRLFLSNPGSMIWTTTSSSSYGATLGSAVNTQLASNNSSQQQQQQVHSNHHQQHNLPVVNGGVNNNNKNCPLVPLINGSHDHNSTRINNHHAFNHFKTLGNRSHLNLKGVASASPALINFNSGSSSIVTTPSGTGHLPMMARDRKPLTPEYEVPGQLTCADHSIHQSAPFHHVNHHSQPPLHSQQQHNMLNNATFHSQLHLHHQHQQQQQQQSQQTPTSSSNGSSRDEINYNITDSLEETDLLGSTCNLPPLVRGVNLAATIAEQFENKSNHSESHIYSHIYDPSSNCGCASCDRLSATPTRMISGANGSSTCSSHHNDTCLMSTASGVSTSCRRNGLGLTGGPGAGLNLNLASATGCSSGGSNVTTATAMSSTGRLYHALSPVSSVLSSSRAPHFSPYHVSNAPRLLVFSSPWSFRILLSLVSPSPHLLPSIGYISHEPLTPCY